MSHEQPDRPQDNLGWLLATVSHAFTTELTAQLEAVGVSPRAHCVLSTALQGEYTQTALAHAIGLDKTTMVVTIDALERAGLVERRTVEHRPPRARHRGDRGRPRKVAPRARRSSRGSRPTCSRSLPPRERDGARWRRCSTLVGDRLCTTAECAHPVRRRAERRGRLRSVRPR